VAVAVQPIGQMIYTVSVEMRMEFQAWAEQVAAAMAENVLP
jgi:hypothetical protein